MATFRFPQPKLLLFIGLILIGLSLIAKVLNHPTIFYALLVSGIACKTLYLVNSIRAGSIQPGPALNLLFLGVGLILVFMALKQFNTPAILISIVLYTGITLKAGSLLMIGTQKLRASRKNNKQECNKNVN